jgi:diacylglycerol kinase family enzyme
MVGDRMFMNNVSLGAYAELVADPRYRAGKLATAHAVLPASLRGERELLQVDLGDADGRRHPDVLVLLVAANRYELNGVRERLDGGQLQVSALRARTGAALAGLATPLVFRLLPLALRVLVPPSLGRWTPRVRLQRWATVRSLLRVAAGRQPSGLTTSDRTERTARSV